MEAFLALLARTVPGDQASGLLGREWGAGEPFRRPRRLGPGGEDLPDDPGDGSVEVVGHFVDEADAEGNVGPEPLAGDEPAAGRARADLRERKWGDDRRDDPEL